MVCAATPVAPATRFRCEGGGQCDDLVESEHAAAQMFRSADPVVLGERVQYREQQQCVGAWADRHPLAGPLRGLGATWVDDDDLPPRLAMAASPPMMSGVDSIEPCDAEGFAPMTTR